MLTVVALSSSITFRPVIARARLGIEDVLRVEEVALR